jgi:hypothetical protein
MISTLRTVRACGGAGEWSDRKGRIGTTAQWPT